MDNDNLGDNYKEIAINYLNTEDGCKTNYNEPLEYAFGRVKLNSNIIEKIRNITDN